MSSELSTGVYKTVNKVKHYPLDIQKIWGEVLEYVKPRVGGEVIETWFQPLTLESVDDSKVKIGVPNKFLANGWAGITKIYYLKLSQLLSPWAYWRLPLL